MKRAVSILLIVVMMAMCVNVSAQMDVKVTLDGNEIFFPDAKPFIDERDRVLVPIRFVSEALGALVDWENESRTAKARVSPTIISLVISTLKALSIDDGISI